MSFICLVIEKKKYPSSLQDVEQQTFPSSDLTLPLNIEGILIVMNTTELKEFRPVWDLNQWAP